MAADERLKRLWEWCRDCLYADWGVRPHPSVPQDPFLLQPGAVFVTFRERGALRGCIGSLRADRPLYQDAEKNTLAAANRDPRFPPIDPRTRGALTMEVSLLTPPQPLPLRGEALLRYLERTRSGLILNHPRGRATFLPQVWEEIPDTRTFLQKLSLKAGLGPDGWTLPETTFEEYAVSRFGAPLEGLPG